MECTRERNKERCNCSCTTCGKFGLCCECIAYHVSNRQLPACCFPKEAELTHDRSFEHFARLVEAKAI